MVHSFAGIDWVWDLGDVVTFPAPIYGISAGSEVLEVGFGIDGADDALDLRTV